VVVKRNWKEMMCKERAKVVYCYNFPNVLLIFFLNKCMRTSIVNILATVLLFFL